MAMPETKTRPGTPAKAMSARRRPPASASKAVSKTTSKTAVKRAAELSDEVAQSVEDGQRAAIEAVRKFVDTVDRTLPVVSQREGPSRRQEVVDAALEMADRLVHTQYEFIRKVVDSAAKSLSRTDNAK
jgi:hypothetical protein